MSDKISVRISYKVPEDVALEQGALPPVSEALASYLQTHTSDLEHPAVGLGGADRGKGEGPGSGGNNTVPFSFIFPKFKSITHATLALELRPGDPEITDDGLQFTNHPDHPSRDKL